MPVRIGVGVAVIAALLHSPAVGLLLGGGTVAVLSIGWLAFVLLGRDAEQTARRARITDPDRAAIDVALFSAAVAGLVTVAFRRHLSRTAHLPRCRPSRLHPRDDVPGVGHGPALGSAAPHRPAPRPAAVPVRHRDPGPDGRSHRPPARRLVPTTYRSGALWAAARFLPDSAHARRASWVA